MGTGPQKDEAVVQEEAWNFQLPSHSLGKREGPEIELTLSHTYMMKPP